MYPDILASQIVAKSLSSATLRKLAPSRLHISVLHIATTLGPGRAPTLKEIESVPLEQLEDAAKRALNDFPSWGIPESPPRRVNPAEKLEAVNAETARKAAERKRAKNRVPPRSPAERQKILAGLTPKQRHDYSNGDPQLKCFVDGDTDDE